MQTRYVTVSLGATTRDAIEAIDRNVAGIVAVVDAEGRLSGTITDGDVRRAMLDGLGLDTSVKTLLERKKGSAYEEPLFVRDGASTHSMMDLMGTHHIHQLPVLDSEDRVIGIVTMDDLLPESGRGTEVQAVVMAGGKGMRLRPLTQDTPKPMLSVGNRPLLERIIEQLRESSIQNVSISTNYLAEKIKDHFKDGSGHEVHLSYLSEDEPLGTAGALSLMDPPDDTVLVMNGDILTGINFQRMFAFHREHSAKLTMAVRQFDVSVPYGVVEFDGASVNRVVEKPVYPFFVNAGIYLIEREAWDRIPKNTHYNMTDLIDDLLADGENVAGFPVWEYWLDIGQMDDFEKAQRDFSNEENGK